MTDTENTNIDFSNISENLNRITLEDTGADYRSDGKVELQSIFRKISNSILKNRIVFEEYSKLDFPMTILVNLELYLILKSVNDSYIIKKGDNLFFRYCGVNHLITETDKKLTYYYTEVIHHPLVYKKLESLKIVINNMLFTYKESEKLNNTKSFIVVSKELYNDMRLYLNDYIYDLPLYIKTCHNIFDAKLCSSLDKDNIVYMKVKEMESYHYEILDIYY